MKMKLAAIALSGAMLSGAAFGLEFDPTFYVGAEAQYNKLKNGKDYVDSNNENKSMIRKNTPGAGLFLGTKVTENFGAELGYTALGKSNKTYQDGEKLNVKMNNAYVDALGYIPVANDIDVIGAVGVGRLSTKTQFKDAAGDILPLTEEGKKDAKTKTGIRLGAGVQYKFDNNLGARAMVRHQKGNKVVKNVNSAGVGLFYQF